MEDVQLISLEDTYYSILHEDIDLRVEETRDRNSKKNDFLTKPQGIIIQDSYNNFAFPIQPMPRVDSNKLDLPVLTKRFKELYLQFQNNVLPWHYVIEMIGNRYFVFNTRPITMRYPLKHNELIKREEYLPFGVVWNDETKDFMNKRRFLIEEAIHVCILGDSTLDVYPKTFYKTLGQFCIKPFLYWFKMNKASKTQTFTLNVGDKFNFDYLFKFLFQQ